MRARFRKSRLPGAMNKTEARFISMYLEPRRLAGEIVRYEYEGLKVRFGSDMTSTYTPDFIVFRSDGEIELADCKGSAGWTEATRIKMKACAAKWPEFHWVGYIEAKRCPGKFIEERF